MGPDEVSADQVKLKNLLDGSEITVPTDETVLKIKALLEQRP